MLLEAERSRRRGRCREVDMSGDEGSFLTTILGAAAAAAAAGGPRDLVADLRLEEGPSREVGGDMGVVVGLIEEEGCLMEERDDEDF